ncbi:MAG TPA: hypothetical protein ENK06_06405 [Gammaproteobacteria bacterium]|nr:hypothetical protein [Gammaproteobacteria bacterium]
MIKKTTLANWILAYFLFLLSTSALAHKVNMFAYAEGDSIFMEGYFADGKKAKNSQVTVFNAAGDKVLTGKTDGEGQYTFPIPEISDLRIVLNAGMGHQTAFFISADELTGTEADEESDSKTMQNRVTNRNTDQSPGNQELTRIVEHAVAKAMRPLMRSVSEMREAKSLSSIVGGIGFIFGMMGIYFYFKAKKDFENKDL